jgi:type VI secretion system protein ImpF
MGPVRLSVFDRLLDPTPPATAAESIMRLKESIRRDLEWLLNTVQTPAMIPPKLQSTIWAYGLPDLGSIGTAPREIRDRLVGLIRVAIKTFEPRLTDVDVTPSTGPENKTALGFLVTATLRTEPGPEPIAYRTELNLSSGEYRVSRGETSAA